MQVSGKVLVKAENTDHIVYFFPHFVTSTGLFLPALKTKKKPQTDSVLRGLLCDELSVFLTHKSIKLNDSSSHFIAGETGLQRFPMATICF